MSQANLAVLPQSANYRSVDMVSIGDLSLSDSPRLNGESAEHLRILAESDAVFPPIVVHRPTMRVVDGVHRVRAAMLRGEDRIAVRFFDGDEKDAFVLAVRANIAHGLPLSLADRTSAAARIISSHPQWSDRAIAAATGLSHKTVAGIRRRTTGASCELDSRVGRDGRIRPLNTTQGREAAAALIAEKPNASLREIARATGISMGTARDVRSRLERGEDPVLRSRRNNHGWCEEPDQPPTDTRGPRPRGDLKEPSCTTDHYTALIHNLRRDPSLRLNETGRSLLRMLDTHAMDAQAWAHLSRAVPARWTDVIAAMARENANAWQRFAQQLEADVQ